MEACYVRFLEQKVHILECDRVETFIDSLGANGVIIHGLLKGRAVEELDLLAHEAMFRGKHYSVVESAYESGVEGEQACFVHLRDGRWLDEEFRVVKIKKELKMAQGNGAV